MKTLIWYTQDLRTTDHPGLEWAISQKHQIIALYAFDDKTPTSGPRFNFIQESIVDLGLQLEKLNISLLVFNHDQQAVACEFIETHEINCIITSKAHNFRKRLWQKSLENKFSKIKFCYFSTDTLLDLENSGMKAVEIPDTFTTFRKKIEQKWKVEPLSLTLGSIEKKFEVKKEFLKFNSEKINLSHFASDFCGGRTNGLERIQHYIWKTKALLNYKETRNGMINFDDSSKFSPWLSLGCVSAKEIYWQVHDFENQVEKNDSTYWLIFELLWRDYFKFLAEKYQQKIFLANGISNQPVREWPKSSYESFELWKTGQTEDPFINANMIELASTGWMSNRGRQNVASYLAKTLNVDWTLGAQWFEENLIDFDCESNWGNWLYQSGFGTDPRNRVFNPQIQAQHYDPDKAYQNKWLSARGTL